METSSLSPREGSIQPSRKKQWLLAGASLLALLLFFLMPRNARWMRERIIAYWKDLPAQASQLQTEQRMQERFKAHYTYAKAITDGLSQQTDIKRALVLVPSTAYFKSKGIDFPVPEPAAFYYFTGLKTVWAHNKNAAEANWYITVDSNVIKVDSVQHRDGLLRVIDSLKQYDPVL